MSHLIARWGDVKIQLREIPTGWRVVMDSPNTVRTDVDVDSFEEARAFVEGRLTVLGCSVLVDGKKRPVWDFLVFLSA